MLLTLFLITCFPAYLVALHFLMVRKSTFSPTHNRVFEVGHFCSNFWCCSRFCETAHTFQFIHKRNIIACRRHRFTLDSKKCEYTHGCILLQPDTVSVHSLCAAPGLNNTKLVQPELLVFVILHKIQLTPVLGLSFCKSHITRVVSFKDAREIHSKHSFLSSIMLITQFFFFTF